MEISLDSKKWKVVVTSRTCPGHEKYPESVSLPWCTCSSSYSLVEDTDEESEERAMEKYCCEIMRRAVEEERFIYWDNEERAWIAKCEMGEFLFNVKVTECPWCLLELESEE